MLDYEYDYEHEHGFAPRRNAVLFRPAGFIPRIGEYLPGKKQMEVCKDVK